MVNLKFFTINIVMTLLIFCNITAQKIEYVEEDFTPYGKQIVQINL
ncbi:MAG: hypothetical protein ABIJ97_10525 [Bacteroidota bacterium]